MRHPSVPIGLPDEGEESPVTEPAGIVLFAAARRSPAVLLGLPDEGTVAGRGQWLLQRPCALRWEELDLPVAPRHRRVCRTPKTPDGDAACPTTTGYRPRGCYDSSGTRARAQAGTSAEPRVSRGRKREGGDAVIQGYFRTYRGALACMMFAVAASSGCARTGRVRSILPMRCLLLLGLLADARKIVAHPPEAVENWYSTGTVGAPAVLPVRLAGPFGEGEPLLGDLASALNGDASQAFPGFRDGEEVRKGYTRDSFADVWRRYVTASKAPYLAQHPLSEPLHWRWL